MKTKALILLLAAAVACNVQAQTNKDRAAVKTVAKKATGDSKFEQDRAAIMALAGHYKVTFNYAETFAPDTAYKFHPRYNSWGYEWAVIAEDSPKKIVIQHLLAIDDSTVIKHWREDWVYEETNLLAFDQGNTWKMKHLKPAEAKGRWVQKVYQVDDSPRYEGIGTWVHVDGNHQWQSETDSPLPRREYTKRNDYNVLRRGNRVFFTKDGVMFEQDNKKIVRKPEGDKLLAQEKGYEEFTKVDPAKFAYAEKWWGEQKAYWADVRTVWDGVFAKRETLQLETKKNGKNLYQKLFDLGDQSVKEKWSSTKNKEEAAKIINNYLAVI
ncbi:DUF6607 family protein [Mucilaginibacter myungsuensis]|uniref:Uncharacterized protein n=1 Tax=Mucilaginibacter myungsuensis TaxID=649104 RepID=A0A929KWA6_9SPHI|nr:DUF6607 family protein [Mucilaginibacter myungsuensis]MBE9661618.1 hypothetical protein [Mucilaginibacter myungsuensis]MDN3597762.1 hypothetical protein [Mucilaginibacter myungsuensis]